MITRRRTLRCNRLILILFFLFSIWVVLQFLAPLAVPKNSLPNLDSPTKNIPFPWSTIYSAGSLLCHQKADRSLYFNGNQMPFCTRCTAIWLGIVLGLGFMLRYLVELNEKSVTLILLGLVPIAIDGIGQLLGFWESTNILRFATGLLAGIISGISMAMIIDEIKKIVPIRVLTKINKRGI